jgi:hypothetical protein
MGEPVETGHRHISDYERAVCYYAYSRSSANVTLALILVYGLCLLEAAGALVYGFLSGERIWATVGMVALAGMILFGVVVFSARALAAEIRRRRTLAIADREPDPEASKELPDPFADHVLLLRPADEGRESFDITDRDGDTLYRVRIEEDGRLRRVLDAEENPVIDVRIPQFSHSFALEGMLPQRAEIYVGDESVARIRQRFSFGPTSAEIVEGRIPEIRRFNLRETAIFQGNRLVGRIYLLRDHAYLDVERSALGKALLGLLVSLSYEKAHTALL